jgi:Extensin-like protein C-terminus
MNDEAPVASDLPLRYSIFMTRWALVLLLSIGLCACSGDDGASGGTSGGGSGGTDGGLGGASGGTGGGSGASGASGASGGSSGAAATGGGSGSGGAGGNPNATCLEKLDALGVAYENTVAKGVVDAVHVTDGMFNGVFFAVDDTDNPIEDPIACEFVLRLWQYADVLASHGIHKIGTLGSYCYRCCCAWSTENFCRGPNDPEPDCSQAPYQGFSNHSFGRALDTRYFYTDAGPIWDINDPSHWVIWNGTGSTCNQGLAAQSGVSQELYSLWCEISSKQIFGTILTPNYNSAHRNHVHADIGKSGDPTNFVVYSSESSIDVFGDE